MDIKNIDKAKSLINEFNRYKRIKEDLEKTGVIVITIESAARKTYGIGFSEHENAFIQDLKEAVSRHLERTRDEIEAI